jgi:hypothetical protein
LILPLEQEARKREEEERRKVAAERNTASDSGANCRASTAGSSSGHVSFERNLKVAEDVYIYISLYLLFFASTEKNNSHYCRTRSG